MTQRRIYPGQTTVEIDTPTVLAHSHIDHSPSESTTGGHMAMCGLGNGLFLEVKSRMQSVIRIGCDRIRNFINQRHCHSTALGGSQRTWYFMIDVRRMTTSKNVIRLRIIPNNIGINGHNRRNTCWKWSPNPELGIIAFGMLRRNWNFLRIRIGMRGTGTGTMTVGRTGVRANHKRAPSQADTVKRRAYVRTYVRMCCMTVFYRATYAGLKCRQYIYGLPPPPPTSSVR